MSLLKWFLCLKVCKALLSACNLCCDRMTHQKRPMRNVTLSQSAVRVDDIEGGLQVCLGLPEGRILDPPPLTHQPAWNARIRCLLFGLRMLFLDFFLLVEIQMSQAREIIYLVLVYQNSVLGLVFFYLVSNKVTSSQYWREVSFEKLDCLEPEKANS